MRTKIGAWIRVAIGVVVSIGVAFLVAQGCRAPEGIFDIETANKANEHARRLAAGAYTAINEGRPPSQVDLKDLAEAEKVYLDLKKFDPVSWGPPLELGRIDIIQGDNRTAEENFDQFFELAKDKSLPMEKGDAHFLKGTAILRMGRADEADREADLALEIQPENPTYLLFKASCLEALKRRPEAKRILIEVLRNNPENTDARAMLKGLNKDES